MNSLEITRLIGGRLRFILWFAAVILMFIGCLFGFASAEDYRSVLTYSIVTELLSVCLFIYLSKTSSNIGKAIAWVLALLGTGVLIQAVVRISTYF